MTILQGMEIIINHGILLNSSLRCSDNSFAWFLATTLVQIQKRMMMKQGMITNNEYTSSISNPYIFKWFMMFWYRCVCPRYSWYWFLQLTVQVDSKGLLPGKIDEKQKLSSIKTNKQKIKRVHKSCSQNSTIG